MPANDIAIYAPFSAPLLHEPPRTGFGGAERQMTLVARRLGSSGLRVCQIVFADAGLPSERAGVRILQRAAPRVGTAGGAVREVLAIWAALQRADARTVVHRSAGADVGVTAMWCRLRGRRFVYSSSSTADFTGKTLEHRPRDLRLHRAGLRMAHVVVVQTEEQWKLAEDCGIAANRLRLIPSLAEPAAAAHRAEHFLWAGGAATYKQPERFVELARACPEVTFVMVLSARPGSEVGLDDRAITAAAADVPNLEILGALPHPELMTYLDRAAGLVNTSAIEGMSNTFLEAWARGVPVLSLTVDPDGLLSTGGLGAAAGGSVQRLAELVRDIWARRADAASGRDDIRRRVAERHGPQAVTAAWMQLLA